MSNFLLWSIVINNVARPLHSQTRLYHDIFLMRPNIGRVGQGDTPQEWFNNLPILTKIILSSTLLSAAAVSFGLSSPASFAFSWELIWNKFQVWRIFTCFLFAGPFSFNFLMHIYMLYQNSLRYEMNPFNTGAGGTSADYLWMLLLGISALSVIAFVFEIPFMAEPFLYLIMYVICKREPEVMMNFFGFQFKAMYLPWVYVGLRLLMGGGILLILFGIGVGHLFYFLVDVIPNTHGVNFIKTPTFCIDFIQLITGISQPRTHFASGGAQANPMNRDRVFQTGHNWGRGRVLGTAD